MRVTSHHLTLMNRHFGHMSLLCLSGDGLIFFHFCCVWGFGMLVVAVPVFQGMRGVSKLLIWRTSSRLFTHTSLPKFLGECLENWTKSRGGIDSNMPNLHWADLNHSESKFPIKFLCQLAELKVQRQCKYVFGDCVYGGVYFGGVELVWIWSSF